MFKASGISASAGFSTSSSPIRHVRDRSFHIGGLLPIIPPCHAKDPGGLLACFSKDMAVPGVVEEPGEGKASQGFKGMRQINTALMLARFKISGLEAGLVSRAPVSPIPKMQNCCFPQREGVAHLAARDLFFSLAHIAGSEDPRFSCFETTCVLGPLTAKVNVLSASQDRSGSNSCWPRLHSL